MGPVIYKIESPTGKVYIGQTWNVVRRFSNYRNLYCKCQTKLYNSLLKYGCSQHKMEIVCELPKDIEQEVLDSYEFLYIDMYKGCGAELMNLREAGSRGKHTEETKLKMRLNWNRPAPTEEKKTKISESVKKYYQTNKPSNIKPIKQYDLEGNWIRDWDSARQAAEGLGIKYKGISSVLTSKDGRYRTYKNFIWKFKI